MTKVKCIYCNRPVSLGDRCEICGNPAGREIESAYEMDRVQDEHGRITTRMDTCPRCKNPQPAVNAINGECSTCGFNINEYVGNGVFGITVDDKIIIDHIPGARIGYTEPMPRDYVPETVEVLCE